MTMPQTSRNTRKIWAIGGGKGGIGKTLFTANMGVALAGMGKKVIAIDADLGGANLHTLLGIKFVQYNLDDYVNRNCELEDAVIATSVENLFLISGANGILGSANPGYFQKLKTIKSFGMLDADYILVDLGAGSSYNVLDFFNAADEKIIIFSPEPTSIQNAYGFIKAAIFRKLIQAFKDRQPVQQMIQQSVRPKEKNRIPTMEALLSRIRDVSTDDAALFNETISNYRLNTIINMLKNKGEQNTAHGLNLTVKKFLNLDINYLGYMEADDRICESVKTMTPFMQTCPDMPASQSIHQIIQQLV